jgi:peptide-methionine (S)-S-oxide reductase
MTENSKTQVAVFGGGCFWCTEAVFEELKGVTSVKPGYAGGTMKNPTYEDVKTGKTGHAEVIKIEYDPESISYNDLLTVFFATHDPTTLNRQGADVGTQYRSAIFYTTEGQKKEAEMFIKKLNESEPKAVTEVRLLDAFYEAEEYHRKYYLNNTSARYCQVVINPKIEKLKTRFHELLKSSGEK